METTSETAISRRTPAPNASCPHCDPPLTPSYRASSGPRRWPAFFECARCGLEWCGESSWVDHDEDDGAPDASEERSVAWRPSVACVAITAAIVLPVAAACFSVVLASVAEVIDDPSFVSVVVLVVIAPVTALVGCFLARVSAAVALRLAAPSRLDREKHTVRVRVDRGWARRTRAAFSRSTLGAVRLKAWQHGTRQLWIEHESGAAMRITDALMPCNAAAERRRIRALLA